MVFSTLHTNSSVATIARLFDLGLKPYVVASALEAIIAQRLVRKICESCRQPDVAPKALLAQMGAGFQADMAFFKGKGCPDCNNSGYRGRSGLYEVLVPSEHMRHLMTSSATVLEIAELAAQEGLTRLIDDARHKVCQGITTLEEVLRVLGPQTIF